MYIVYNNMNFDRCVQFFPRDLNISPPAYVEHSGRREAGHLAGTGKEVPQIQYKRKNDGSGSGGGGGDGGGGGGGLNLDSVNTVKVRQIPWQRLLFIAKRKINFSGCRCQCSTKITS